MSAPSFLHAIYLLVVVPIALTGVLVVGTLFGPIDEGEGDSRSDVH